MFLVSEDSLGRKNSRTNHRDVSGNKHKYQATELLKALTGFVINVEFQCNKEVCNFIQHFICEHRVCITSLMRNSSISSPSPLPLRLILGSVHDLLTDMQITRIPFIHVIVLIRHICSPLGYPYARTAMQQSLLEKKGAREEESA